MPIFVEPDASAYEPEWRLQFEAKDPAGAHVVISGRVTMTQQLEPPLGALDMLIGTSDEKYRTYEVRLRVGPWWQSVAAVVPFVWVMAFDNSNADEDDEQGWSLEGLSWDIAGGLSEGHGEEARIQLKFQVSVKGEN